MKIASRAQIEPFHVMEAFREAQKLSQQGREVLHLSVGQPGQVVPKRVLEKIAKAITSESLGYTDARGTPELRHAIAQHYAEREGIQVSPERIYVTVGSSSAFLLSLLAAFDVGDEVALVAPHYPAYPNMMRAVGLVPVILRATEEINFQPTVAMLKALPRKPAGLIIASPSNPTGTVIEPQVFAEIISYCEAENIRLISDEIYHGITYGDARAVSALAHSQRMLVINSFSKYFLLPGWRVGWVVLPEELLRPYECLLQSFFISPSAVAQVAAEQVLQCLPDLDEVVASYAENRALLTQHFPHMGLGHFCQPQGAFYMYADVRSLTNDSQQFCHDMLHQAGVCAVPGIDFDGVDGAAYVRFSYAGDRATIESALNRLSDWLKR